MPKSFGSTGQRRGGRERNVVNILVVDDEIHVALVLAESIRSQGHEVTVAHDAEEALALLTHYRPHALLLDVALGELSGIDVLRRIRRIDQQLPVVLITGHAVPDQLEEARELGVTDIIEKPLFLNQLTQALEALSKKR